MIASARSTRGVYNRSRSRMNVTDLRRLYGYTDWANDRMLAAIGGLSEEQYGRHVVSSYPTIRDTLAHIVFAEWLWLERWRGRSHAEYPAWMTEPPFPKLEEEMRAIAAERRAFLDDLTEDAIESTIDYRSMKGDPFTMPLGGVMIHCANHSTYHRGQLVTMLRQVGATPPNTDYTQYLRS